MGVGWHIINMFSVICRFTLWLLLRCKVYLIFVHFRKEVCSAKLKYLCRLKKQKWMALKYDEKNKVPAIAFVFYHSICWLTNLIFFVLPAVLEEEKHINIVRTRCTKSVVLGFSMGLMYNNWNYMKTNTNTSSHNSFIVFFLELK